MPYHLATRPWLGPSGRHSGTSEVDLGERFALLTHDAEGTRTPFLRIESPVNRLLLLQRRVFLFLALRRSALLRWGNN